MLKEFVNVRQIEGESKRRWFYDDYFDLIVWFSEKEEIIGFELCYDILRAQRALTWHSDSGFSHHWVDDGENRPGKLKASPVLLADGAFEYQKIAEKFKKASESIEERISKFVYEKLLRYPIQY